MAKLVLARILKKKRVSKRRLAKDLGMRYSNVFALFKPAYNPTFRMLERIAKALGCRIRDLIDEKP